MIEQNIEYSDGSTILKNVLICDSEISGGKSRPGILLFHAFEGRSNFTLDYARNLAKDGYAVFVADMYGEGQTSDTIDGCLKLIAPFLHERELVRRRVLLAYNALIKQSGINQAMIGAMGFCFGGMCVLELARSGVDLAAGVLAHGVLAKSALPTNKIKGSILVLHGYKDPQVPSQALDGFAEEMEEAGVSDWTVTFFGEAKHSFTDPKTGTFDPVKEEKMGREYNKIAAQRSYRYAVDFFNEKLI
jgi:dienelactone hydrolase